MAITALCRVSHGEKKSFIAARKRLKPDVALDRIGDGGPRDIAGITGIRGRRRLDQRFSAQEIGNARHWLVRRRHACLGGCRRRRALRRQREVQQPMRVVESRAQNLAARQILEGGGDAPLDPHRGGIDGLADAEARQGRATGAQQKNRLDQVAARLLDRERGEIAIVKPAFGHDAIDRKGKLLSDLLDRQGRYRRIAAAMLRQEAMRRVDRRLAAFHRDIHVRPPAACCAASRRGGRAR